MTQKIICRKRCTDSKMQKVLFLIKLLKIFYRNLQLAVGADLNNVNYSDASLGEIQGRQLVPSTIAIPGWQSNMNFFYNGVSSDLPCVTYQSRGASERCDFIIRFIISQSLDNYIL
jgi:hypothetical protein